MFTSSLARSQAGVSLVELVAFIVIVGVGLAGVIAAMTSSTGRSADPMLRKQAVAIADARVQVFAADCSFSTVALTDLEGFSVSGVVSGVYPLNGTTTVSQIAVTVTAPGGEAITVTGHRTNCP